MIIVLDTNVLVSALLSPFGPPARILDQVLSMAVQVAYDDRIVSEYSDVLNRPAFGFEPADVKALIDHIVLTGVQTSASPINPRGLPDETDLPFAEVALSGNADVLITGNAEHFRFLEGQGVHVVSPSEFLSIIGRDLEEE